MTEKLNNSPEAAAPEKAERKGLKNDAFFKISAMLILSVIMLIFSSWAWFAMNKESGSSGMGIKMLGNNFSLITLSDDQSNENGVYFDPYHKAILENESEVHGIWLVDSNSNINNYSSTGVDNGTLGIEPGSSGLIKFYIKPNRTLTIDFSLETIGYRARTTTVGGEPQVTMTELSSEAGEAACFLNGHVMLFQEYDSTNHFYSGLIPTGNDGKRVLSRLFELNGAYDADTNGDGTNDAYEVDIYWVWAETLDTLVYNSGSGASLICDKDAVAAEGQTNDYTKVVNNICTYPQYYLKGYSPTATYTESMIVGRNAMYNDADQDIGMNIDYVLLRLDVDDGTGN